MSNGKLNTFGANGHRRVRPCILARMKGPDERAISPISVSDSGQNEILKEELSKHLAAFL